MFYFNFILNLDCLVTTLVTRNDGKNIRGFR